MGNVANVCIRVCVRRYLVDVVCSVCVYQTAVEGLAFRVVTLREFLEVLGELCTELGVVRQPVTAETTVRRHLTLDQEIRGSNPPSSSVLYMALDRSVTQPIQDNDGSNVYDL